VRNEKMLVTHRVKEKRSILQTKRTTNWIGHIWRRNCHVKHVFEGKIGGGIAVTGIRGIRNKQLPDDLMKRGVPGN
jgi:hypothetical protein